MTRAAAALAHGSPASPRASLHSAIQSGDPWVRGAVWTILFSILFLPRFGINIGGFSIAFSMVAVYAAIAIFALSGRLACSPTLLVLYVTCVLVALTSLVVNHRGGPGDLTSPTSLALLLVMYMPFVFRLSTLAREPDLLEYSAGVFLRLSLVVALAGLAQFLLQFFIRSRWLLDFGDLIPLPLRATGVYNTVIEVERGYKSNGFFLREPSGFSFLMAFALMLELQTRRRPLCVAAYALALMVSYSGTGILALIVGLLFPLGRRALARAIGAAAVAVVAVVVLDDILNLSFTVRRIEEFGEPNSSAYQRYVAPMKLLVTSLERDPWSALLGHGPGAIARVMPTVRFDSHDPTWAKLMFEYGLLGTSAITALFIAAVRQGGALPRMQAVQFASWAVMGGHLLTADVVYLHLLLLGVWRGAMSQGQARDAVLARPHASG